MAKLLIISEDIVGRNMAGPAIRCYEFARALSGRHEVTLAVPLETDVASEGFSLVTYDNQSLGDLARAADVVLASGYLLRKHPVLQSLENPLVIDIYDPFILENLEVHSAKPMAERVYIHDGDLGVQLESLAAGDFFLCASERQRGFWLGMLAAANRVNPVSYEADREVRKLIDVVPFGIPDYPPRQTKRVLKGVFPGIGESDKVILWGGGIWNWFDPITLIRAMKKIADTRDDIKLFFLGVKHPNPDIPAMDMCRQAIALSEELGLTGRTVFFNDWAPYEDRQNYLLEADAGVSLHFDHLETKFSFRTRILDCFWAALPVITTRGDSLSDVIERNQLGLTVAPGDEDATVEAILRLLDDAEFSEQCRRNIREIAPAYFWSEVVKPLDAFCKNPVRSADRGANSKMYALSGGVQAPKRSLSGRIINRLRRL